jgi:hypothetical protein
MLFLADLAYHMIMLYDGNLCLQNLEHFLNNHGPVVLPEVPVEPESEVGRDSSDNEDDDQDQDGGYLTKGKGKRRNSK